MRIRLHQLNPTVGDLEGNKSLILNALHQAEKDQIDLVIVQEMCLTAYPAHDLLEMESFRQRCYQINEEICSVTKQTALLFGTITSNNKAHGRKMYNSAILAQNGEELTAVHKTLLPTYDVFDDLRYFEPNEIFEPFELNGIKLGITICEDIWYNENEVQYHKYSQDLVKILNKKGADFFINISASPFTSTKHESRLQMLKKNAEKVQKPILYCNQTGCQTDIIFDGDSVALNGNGEVVAQGEAFAESYTDVVAKRDRVSDKIEIYSDQKNIGKYPQSGPERQFEAIKRGFSDYLDKTGLTRKVIFGLSGGIDSALVAVLAAEVVGAENVTAITMPTSFSSEGSVSHSQILADNLGIQLYEVPIQPIFDASLKQLEPLFENIAFNVAEENLQSRIRGMLLMAYSNKFGGFVIPTGNKSEYAVGYATLYGDMNGALAIIGDLYKTQVYQMAEWLNAEYYQKEVIPVEIITKAPSAELRPDQKDSDTLPEYEVLDDILYHYIERQLDANTIAKRGHELSLVNKVIRMMDQNEFKRKQSAPILRLSGKAFGMGRRFPIVQQWTRNHLNI